VDVGDWVVVGVEPSGRSSFEACAIATPPMPSTPASASAEPIMTGRLK
jgi:hypothetical protein